MTFSTATPVYIPTHSARGLPIETARAQELQILQDSFSGVFGVSLYVTQAARHSPAVTVYGPGRTTS